MRTIAGGRGSVAQASDTSQLSVELWRIDDVDAMLVQPAAHREHAGETLLAERQVGSGEPARGGLAMDACDAGAPMNNSCPRARSPSASARMRIS